MKETEPLAAEIERATRHVNLLESSILMRRMEAPEPAVDSSSWLKVGAIAAASAVLGGLAAAWFYRKTLSRLREAGNEITETRVTRDGSAEDF